MTFYGTIHYTVGRFRVHGRLCDEKWPLKEFPVRMSEFAIKYGRPLLSALSEHCLLAAWSVFVSH